MLKDQGNDVRVKVEFALGNAIYCSVHDGVRVTDEFALKVEDEMKRLRDISSGLSQTSPFVRIVPSRKSLPAEGRYRSSATRITER